MIEQTIHASVPMQEPFMHLPAKTVKYVSFFKLQFFYLTACFKIKNKKSVVKPFVSISVI